MTVKRFNASFKTRDDIFDQITPKNVVQTNVSAPAGEWKPASWLPVEWTGSASEDAFVISSGKPVAFDGEGRIIPAGLATVIDNATLVGDTFITYTSTDVTYGVVDVRTGLPLLTADIGAVTVLEFTDAMLARGIVAESEVEASFTDGITYNRLLIADLQAVASRVLSDPIGVAAYDVYVWAGGVDQNDYANRTFTNYQKQGLVQFLTDVQLRAPVLAALSQTSAAISTFTAWTGSAADGSQFPDASSAPAELWLTSTQLATLSRYGGTGVNSVTAGDDVIALQLEGLPLAADTDRTPITSTTTALLRKRSSISAISQAGDYWIDVKVGLIFVYELGGNALPTPNTDTISYSYYGTGNASDHRHVHFVDLPFPGDYVGIDEESNFVSQGSTSAGSIGRVLEVQAEPRGLLDRVRTGFQGSNFAKTAQMPGTATKGFSDLITLSDETVADSIAIVNIKMS
jgi:hypothetical protein